MTQTTFIHHRVGLKPPDLIDTMNLHTMNSTNPHQQFQQGYRRSEDSMT